MAKVDGNIDVISYAAQIGRLDYVTTSLTILGIFIGLAAILSFIHFRRVAKKEAKEVSKKVAEKVAERVTNQYIQKELLEILRANAHLFNGNIGDDDADSIANAQENEDQ